MPFNFGIGFRLNTSEVPASTTEVPTLQNSAFTPHPRVIFPQVTMSVSQPIMTNSAFVVHAIANNEVYHDLGDNTDPRGRMEDLQ